MARATKQILLVCTVASHGGAAMAILRLAKGLNERGHTVHARYLYARADILQPDYQYEVILKKAHPSLIDYIRITASLLSTITRLKPDVVITFLPLASCLGQLAARVVGIPSRIVSHRVPADTYGRTMRLLDIVSARLGSYTRVITVSEGVRASLAGYPERLRGKIDVVYNGIRSFQRSSFDPQDARRSFGVGPSQFLLVSVGRLDPQKNLSFLIGVMKRLEGCTLLIAGEGGMRKALEDGIRGAELTYRVRLLGNLPKQRIADLLAAADLFATPSLFEGQSNAVLEALLAGVPVVANDIPAQRETIRDADGTVAGLLLPMNEDAWVEAITSFRCDRDLASKAQLAAENRGRAFTFERMIDGFERAL